MEQKGPSSPYYTQESCCIQIDGIPVYVSERGGAFGKRIPLWNTHLFLSNVVVIAACIGDSLFGRPVLNTSHASHATQSISRVTEKTLVATSHPAMSSTWLYLAGWNSITNTCRVFCPTHGNSKAFQENIEEKSTMGWLMPSAENMGRCFLDED